MDRGVEGIGSIEIRRHIDRNEPRRLHEYRCSYETPGRVDYARRTDHLACGVFTKVSCERAPRSVPLDSVAEKTGGPDHLIDLAKSGFPRSLRMPCNRRLIFNRIVVHSMKDTLEPFMSIDESQIQSLAFEIALLGEKRLNINATVEKYSITINSKTCPIVS